MTPAPDLPTIRAELFGDERYAGCFMVQAWWQPDEGPPQVWRQRSARTLAGANRVASSR